MFSVHWCDTTESSHVVLTEEEVEIQNNLYETNQPEQTPTQPDEISIPEEYEQEESIQNLLFVESETTVLNEYFPNIIELILNVAKTISPTKYTNQTTSGSDIAQVIVDLSRTHYTQDDANVFIERFLLPYMTPVPYHFSLVGYFSPEIQYQFIVDGQPRYYHDSVVNPIPRYFVRKNEWHSDEDVQDPKMRPSMIIDEVERIVLEICSGDFVDYLSNTFDYKSFMISQLFVELVRCAENLHYFDFDQVPTDHRKSFYVNLYNMMAIHGAIVKQYAKMNESRRKEFVHEDLYFIGSHRVCLKDLEHMILGQADLIPLWKYRLRRYCLPETDVRLLFLMTNGSKGSPLPHAISQRDCEEDVSVGAYNYINRNAIVSHVGVTFSSLFLKYRNLFPRSIHDLLEYVENSLMGEAKNTLFHLRAQKQILLEYKEWDSKSNQKMKRVDRKAEAFAIDPIVTRDEVVIPYELIMENDYFRSHFRTFCRGEFSMENIIYYEKSTEFKKLTNPIDRRLMAMQIYNMFLSQDSEFEINVNEGDTIEIEDVLFNRGKNRKKKNRKSIFEEKEINYEELMNILSGEKSGSLSVLDAAPIRTNSNMLDFGFVLSPRFGAVSRNNSNTNKATTSAPTTPSTPRGQLGGTNLKQSQSSEELPSTPRETGLSILKAIKEEKRSGREALATLEISNLESIEAEIVESPMSTPRSTNPPQLEVKADFFEKIDQEIEICLRDTFLRFSCSDAYKDMVKEAKDVYEQTPKRSRRSGHAKHKSFNGTPGSAPDSRRYSGSFL
jgi:hypothetical protein